MSRIEQLAFSNGERYPMLLDNAGMPHFWITLFITSCVRPRTKQNTITSYISDLRHFLLWEQIEERDVISEFKKLQFLSETDYLSLRNHCLLKTSDVRKWLQCKSTSVISINKKFPSPPRQLDRVSGNHAANRMTRIAEYLAFTARTILRNRLNIEEINRKTEHMKTKLLSNKPASSQRSLTLDPDSKAPPLNVFQLLIDSVQFGSPSNPYKNPTVKKRNALTFNILNATGARASEILSLKLEDIDYHQNLISIRRRHDDPIDPRKNQPVAKTLGRDIPVSAELIEQIMNYIENERAKTPNTNKHPFLIVTHQKSPHLGSPLSGSGFAKTVRHAVNKISREATGIEQENLVKEITRHGFRHNFNYRLSKLFDAHNEKAKTDPSIKKISEREENQIRMQLNGWTSEETANTYNLRHIKEISRRLLMEDMEAQSKQIRWSNK